jgi:hypothetical protein
MPEIAHCPTCQLDVEIRIGRIPTLPCPECHRPMKLLGNPATIARDAAAIEEEEDRLP